jgi:UDP-galactopyranose mutase
MFDEFDVIIVGSGFFGSTIAERINSNFDLKVAVLEARDHIGGNSYSEIDALTQIEYHKYGSHLFHTDNLNVWEYCKKFTTFNNYRHKVLTVHKGEIFSLPINLGTINQFYRSSLSPQQARLKILELGIEHRENSEESLESKAISLIGKDLYEAFIKNYTKKQWQTDPKFLPASIIKRLPVRYNYNNEYFDDAFQGVPTNGYTKWIEKMLEKSRIYLNTDYFDVKDKIDSSKIIIYTGPIDKFFAYEFGDLTWRTLDFELEVKQTNDYQGNSVINYSDLDVEFTRVHEFKHLHPERNYGSNSTLIMKEYSKFAERNDEPYYPVNSSKDRIILNQYRQLIAKEKNVYFGGRLGTYQYLDMHMAIASALSFFENTLKPRLQVI